MELTGTFHALVDESVEQRTTVVTEGGAGVGVDPEVVSTFQVLESNRNSDVGAVDTHTHTLNTHSNIM